MSTAPTSPAAVLRELHRLRRHIKDLQDSIERLPRQLKIQQGKVTRQEELLKQAQDTIKKLKVTILEKESALKSKHQEIGKREKQRNESVANKKEYDALGAEIAQAKQTCSQLEDDILTAMADTEERTAQLPELEKTLKTSKQEVAQFDQTSKARQAELTALLEKAQADLKEAETGLPEDVRPQYQRQVSARGEDAMAAVQNNNCQACYTGITAQQSNELAQGLFVICKMCGRILYLPE